MPAVRSQAHAATPSQPARSARVLCDDDNQMEDFFDDIQENATLALLREQRGWNSHGLDFEFQE